jgi:phosphatidylinositol alpha-1,6-mannosyltransferase
MSGQCVYSVEKVLFITNDFPPQSGGIETFIAGLIAQLPKDSVVVQTSRQDNLDGQEEYDQKIFDNHGVVVVRDRQKILLPTRNLRKRVAGTIHAHSIKTVVFGASVPLGLLAPSLRKLGVQRIVAITHGHEVWWSKVPIFSNALRKVAKHVDYMTHLGEFTKGQIAKALNPSDIRKLISLPPGVDIHHFTPGVKPEYLMDRYGLAKKKVILCLGRIVQRKGQDVLIDAMVTLQETNPEAVLLIVGTGNYERTLHRKVLKLNLENSVKFLGRIPYHELPDHLRLADIFASPTRDRFGGLEVEGLGIVYLEASAAGVAVLAGSSGGAPDAVQQGITGFIVNGRDRGEITRSLREMLDNSARTAHMGEQGREWMEREWSWEIIGARFRSLLDLD